MGGRDIFKSRWRGILAAALFSSTAGAEEERPASAVTSDAKSELRDVPASEPEEDQALTPKVKVFGRVFARATADGRQAYRRRLNIPSARLGLEASVRYLQAEVSADLSSEEVLRDAYVRLADGSKRFRLYGGQFKAPFLERQLRSSWSLPLTRRGLVESYLTDTQHLGGRRLGLMSELNLKDALGLRVSAGAFQGMQDELGQRTSEDLSGRVSVRPWKVLKLGASSYVAEAFETVKRYAVATDATLALGAFELSGEYVQGRLLVGDFTAELALASYTLGLGDAGWALQPVAGAEMIQLRGASTGRGHALVGGLNVLYADLFQADLQVERALRPGDERPGLQYSLQLATRF